MSMTAAEARRLALTEVSRMMTGSLGAAVIAAADAAMLTATDDDPNVRFQAGRILQRAFVAIEEVTSLAKNQLISLEAMPSGTVQ